MALAVILVLAGAVRALRFWDGFASWAHWDDAKLPIQAIQILGGTFPVHYLGIEYAGATPAYPLAAWFALLGSSTLAFDMVCWAVGVAVAWTGYVLARRVLSAWPAFCAGVVLAVPPLVFTRWSTTGNLTYPVTLLIGNLILLGTHQILFRRPAHAPAVLVTGLLVGVGCWNFPLVVVYCAPLAVLALRTGLVWRPRFWLFPIGVAVAGLPAWLYEIVHYPSTRLVLHEAGSVSPTSFSARVTMFVTDLFLELTGARAIHLATVPFAAPAPLQAMAVGICLLVVARALLRDRSQLSWLVGSRSVSGTGLSILWIVVAANLALVLPAKRALEITYFLPLYAVLPLWTGECLAWLWRVRRWLGATAMIGVLGFNVWSTWTVTMGRHSEPGWRWSHLRGSIQPLVDWLAARGIRHVYVADLDVRPFELSFVTGMRVIAADPWREDVVAHGQLVDAQVSPPTLITARRADELRPSLRALGQPIRETDIGTLIVFETDPVRPYGFIAVPPDRWTLTASHESANVGYLVDRDAGTRWSTGRPQTPGSWVQVDLEAEEEVARVDLLALDWQEVPAGFRVEWSRDGRTWQEAVSVSRYWGPLFVSERHPFLRVRRGRVQAVFDPVRTRFLRIVQTGESSHHAWSARELFVYRPDTRRPMAPELPDLTGELRREGVSFVYASHWLSARVLAEGRGEIGALDSNLNVNSYGRTVPEPTKLEPFRLEAGHALLLGADTDLAATRRSLEVQGALTRQTTVGPYPLLLLARPSLRRALDRHGWQLAASVAASEASGVLDGDSRTRWSAQGAVGTGTHVTVDLGQARPVAGIRMMPGPRDAGPSAFVLESSLDGIAWTPVGPSEWAGPLYWTGYELIRNGHQEWTVVFPRTTLRQLRVRPAAVARTWDIAELDLFE